MAFEDALTRIPPPGRGCHPYLLTLGNYAAIEGIELSDAVTRIARAIPPGARPVTRQEIEEAVFKAFEERRSGGGGFTRAAVPIDSLRKATAASLLTFLHPSEDITFDSLRGASPVMFDPEDGITQMLAVLQHLYHPDEYLYCGDTFGTDVYTVRNWVEVLTEARDADLPEHFCWNPYSGVPAPTKDGTKDSYRCDNAVRDFRFAMVEFDKLDIGLQLRFWAGARLPVAAIVFSGGKSLHGILRVTGIENLADWGVTVRRVLYQRWLVPIGVDPACANPSRLSRTPGAIRASGVRQDLIYLNPAATPLYLEM